MMFRSSRMLRLGPLVMLAALLVVAVVSMQAQAPPHGFAGTFVSMEGDSVTLQDKDGKMLVVLMTPGWTLSKNRTVDASAIKAGDFIASTNTPVSDDTGRATELRILEPGYRPEEGTHALSATSANMMTHGTVTAAMKTDEGVKVDVTYPGGVRHLVLGANVTVTLSEGMPRSALKPGVQVMGVTRPGADGVQHASRLQL